MGELLFTDDLSVGVVEIDLDHQTLVALINLLDDAIEGDHGVESVASVLTALTEYAKYHFLREEYLMAAVGYPGLDAHVRVHERFKARLGELLALHAAAPSAVNASDVLDLMKSWLFNHIKIEDHRYVPFMVGKEYEIAEANRRVMDELADLFFERGCDDTIGFSAASPMYGAK
ncbi:MAG: bacteriohemerythrin [Magnetospirillum sp. WYHS-4]